MRIKVRITQDTHGMLAGSERNLRPNIAAQLIKLGLAEEIGRVSEVTTKRRAIQMESIPVEVEVVELVEELVEKPKRKRKKKDDNSSDSNV